MPSIGAWEVKKISAQLYRDQIMCKDFLKEGDLNYRVWKSEPGMTAVTHWLMAGLLAAAEPDFLTFRSLVLYGCKTGPFMRPITKRLVFTLATSAPPVVCSCFNIDSERCSARDFRTCHGFLPAEETIPEILSRFCVTITWIVKHSLK